MFRILVVDDDSGLRMAVKSALTGTGRFEVDEAFDGVDALEKVMAKPYNMVILDVDMPRMNGLQALKEIKEHDPSIAVIILTAYGTIDMAVQAVKDGAYNYVSKPVKSDHLVEMVDRAFNAVNLISRVAMSAPQMKDSERTIIGNTIQMQKVFHIIMRLSKVETPVLVRGASGTGKELVARAIHHNSAFKEGKFVAINCSAIPENLFESELFGHEKGAFTGADQRKIGRFQYAEGGTLFLDEIGDLPLHMQVKLLRVLQEKVFTPVGSNREIETHTRIIAATNRPLEEMIKKNQFRDDLYYRLNVMPIFLPALAERRSDIDHLTNLFIQKFNKEQGKKILGVTEQALSVLKRYDWPGNIRELENIIEHSFILEETNMLTVTSLPENLLRAVGVELPQLEHLAELEAEAGSSSDEISTEEMIRMPEGALDFNKHKEAFEKEFIIKALKMFKGRINQTALHANIPKKTLLRKIEKYGIVARDYFE
jgi:two-component system, NtrC family, response regulator HydG